MKAITRAIRRRSCSKRVANRARTTTSTAQSERTRKAHVRTIRLHIMSGTCALHKYRQHHKDMPDECHCMHSSGIGIATESSSKIIE